MLTVISRPNQYRLFSRLHTSFTVFSSHKIRTGCTSTLADLIIEVMTIFLSP